MFKLLKLKFLSIIVILVIAGCVPIRMPNYRAWRPYEAQNDMDALSDRVVLPHNKPLTLCEVIDYAMENNLEVRIQELEKEVSGEAIAAQRLRMMPELNIDEELSERNHINAYSTKPIGGVRGTPGTSSERNVRKLSETLVWSSLNFGMAYFRARREIHEAMMLEQRHHRAQQNLILDIFRAYYRALIAQRAQDKAKALVKALEEREKVLLRQIEKQLVPELEALVNRDQLIGMRVRLLAFENEERSAMTELKALMGIPPSREIRLADVMTEEVSPHLPSIHQLEGAALVHRPELLSQDMKVQMDAEEVRATIHSMYPDMRLFVTNSLDDDKYLYFNNWITVGYRAAIELLSIPSKYREAKSQKIQVELDRKMRLSMSMGVLTQVHLAYINVSETMDQYQLAQELYKTKYDLLDGVEKLYQRGKASPSEVLVREVETLFAEVNEFKAYSNVLIALEQLDNAIGLPLRFTGEEIRCHHQTVQKEWDDYCYMWSQPVVEYCGCEEESKEDTETPWYDDPY